MCWLTAAMQVCGHVKHRISPVIILHTSNTHIQQAVLKETVISLNDFKLWDQLETFPCSTCIRGTWESMVLGRDSSLNRDFFSYLIAKLQFIRCQHDDVIIDGKHSLCLNLVVGEEAVTELVLFCSDNFERNADLWPERLYQRDENTLTATA